MVFVYMGHVCLYKNTIINRKKEAVSDNIKINQHSSYIKANCLLLIIII